MDENFQSWVWTPDGEKNSFWRSWLSDHPHKAHEIDEARHLLQRLKFPEYTLPEEEVVKVWKHIQGLELKSRKNIKPQQLLWWQWAAAAVVLLGITFFLTRSGEETTIYTTSYGETKNIVLPDESVVVLNANSKLSFKDNWDNTSFRALDLEGESYFSVTHKKNNQPFKVNTEDGVSVEVLGTTFNVYHRTKETKVVLNSGKISLSLPNTDENEKIIMKPGDLVEFKSNQYSKTSVDPQRYVAWTENRLVLDRTSLREMVQMIKDNYGVEVAVTPVSLLDQTVSGSMPAGEKDELINQIAKAFRLKAVQEKNKIVITE
jgi:ferric-dicitrate binding protein FerR (iron transport regulator)